MGESCAICLNPVRRTRHTPELKCGHVFHTNCLGNWEDKGGERCPLCRKMLNGAEYRVTLTIENLSTETSNTTEVPIDAIRSLVDQLHLDELDFSTEIHFDVDNVEDLREVLTEWRLPDPDSFILNTE